MENKEQAVNQHLADMQAGKVNSLGESLENVVIPTDKKVDEEPKAEEPATKKK